MSSTKILTRLVPLVCSLLLVGCSTIERADYDVVSERTGLTVTRSGTPAGAQPLGIVYSEQSALWLFGFIPLRDMSMERTLTDLAEQAKELGADGVGDISMSYQSTNIFDLLFDPYPWGATMTMHGEAWRR